jgi:HSP20 family molecular chaperone IbpA
MRIVRKTSAEPGIAIRTIPDQDEAALALLAETEQKFERVRGRAWDFFQERGRSIGDDLGDWFRAESELFWKPHSEMFENELALVLRVAVPGFDQRSIQITAAPHLIAVQANETHCHSGLESRLRFCEFGESLFRRFDLGAVRIDPKTVRATLDKGILEIVASKATKHREPVS